MGKRIRLADLIETDGPGCMWPNCQRNAQQVAHLHSKGAGGTPDGRRNRLSNLAGMCNDHALMTDSGRPTGWEGYRLAHAALLGDGWEWRLPYDRWAFERAEALTAHVGRRRARLGIVIEEEP